MTEDIVLLISMLSIGLVYSLAVDSKSSGALTVHKKMKQDIGYVSHVKANKVLYMSCRNVAGQYSCSIIRKATKVTIRHRYVLYGILPNFRS